MSSNQRRPNYNGGGGGKSNRNRNRNQKVREGNTTAEEEKTGAVVSAEEEAQNNNGITTQQELPSSSSNTANVNSPAPAKEEEDDDEGIDEDEDIDEPASVVNASLFVNLSNADVTHHEITLDRSNVLLEEQQQPHADDESALMRVVTDHENAAAARLSHSVESPPQPLPYGLTPAQQQQQQSVMTPPKTDQACSSSEESSTLLDFEVANLMSKAQEEPEQTVKLPSTVTELTAANGVKVYLVGTAHFSQQSQVDVVKTIQQTQPSLVVVELCSSRKNILTMDEETVLKEVSEMNFQKVRLALANSGTIQGTLHLLLLSMSAQLTKKLGMAPGGEFRAAMEEARKIPGCVLLLGDRPFNITISRALAALTFYQKIQLAWQFITSNEDITREEIEKCKERDLLERMLSEMTGEFPTITEVFLNERDVFLAHSLYLAATSDAHRSKGGPVVGVVGMGHVPGIVRNWGLTTDEAVEEISRIPETPLSTIIMRKTVKLVVYSVGVYGAYRVGVRIMGSRHGKIVGSLVGEAVAAVALRLQVLRGSGSTV